MQRWAWSFKLLFQIIMPFWPALAENAKIFIIPLSNYGNKKRQYKSTYDMLKFYLTRPLPTVILLNLLPLQYFHILQFSLDKITILGLYLEFFAYIEFMHGLYMQVKIVEEKLFWFFITVNILKFQSKNVPVRCLPLWKRSKNY